MKVANSGSSEAGLNLIAPGLGARHLQACRSQYQKVMASIDSQKLRWYPATTTFPGGTAKQNLDHLV